MKFIKIGFFDSVKVFLQSFIPFNHYLSKSTEDGEVRMSVRKRCFKKNKITKVYEMGAERLEKEMDIVHTIKNLRNIKIYVKNQDPALYLASKFDDFNFLALDTEEDELKKNMGQSLVMQEKNKKYDNEDMTTSKVFGHIADHNAYSLTKVTNFIT